MNLVLSKEINMKIKTIIITSMTVFALLVGAFLGVTSQVSAQGAEPTASQNGGGENLESVAEALGVTVEALQTALQNARPAECADFERGEKPEGVNCRPDFDAVASELGLTAEQIESAFKTARQQAQTERLTSAAQTLGVTVEALQTALQNARPAECVDGEKPEGVNCRPDFEAAATELGVTTEALQSAMGRGDKGGRGGNLDAVAETLGVTTEALQQALQDARPAECADFERGEKPEGVDCRPDLEAAAETLGVDAEALRTALKNERGGRHGQGESNDERE
jgi:hypothetical protein